MSSTKNYLDVLEANIKGIQQITETVSSTIGPKGLDVMLVDQYGDFQCTNDGVEILSSMQIKHPVAKLMVKIAKAQESKVGDGTTSVAIFVNKILQFAYNKLKSGFQPIPLIKGIEIAIERSIELLADSAKTANDINDPMLRAATFISARGDNKITKHLMELAEMLIEKNGLDFFLKDFNLNSAILPSNDQNTRIQDGYIIKKRSHYHYDYTFIDIKCLTIDGPFEPEAMSSEAISTEKGVEKFDRNISKMIDLAETISKAGIRAVFTTSSMMPKIEEFFIKEGVFVLTNLRQVDLKAIMKMSGANKVNRQKLSSAGKGEILHFAGDLACIEQSSSPIGTIIKGKKAHYASLIISGELDTVIDEKCKIALDAASSMKNTLKSGYLPGEGVAELNLIPALKQYRKELEGLSDNVVAGYDIVVEALPAVFVQILENAGIDPKKVIEKIGASLTNTKGVDLDDASIIDLYERQVVDPLELKLSIFKIAREIVTQILRIKLILQAA